MARVLIVDDDAAICDVLSRRFGRDGHLTHLAHSFSEALELAGVVQPDVALLDVHLPDGNGLALIEAMLQVESRPEVIILSGRCDPDGAELAIKCGAWDYIEKSTPLNTLTLSLNRALSYRAERAARSAPAVDRSAIIGCSHVLQNCIQLIGQASHSRANVLITGETGTGKDLVARTIHRNSKVKGAFVVVDCTILPENLVESILFGHKKGSFTGASESHAGLVEQADGGTLFLDEVAEMPLSMQKVFLRVLQDRRFRPVGAQQEVSSDFNLIAATNRNLDEMVAAGQFRQDLLFRLRAVSIVVPPLRQRPEDIVELVRHRHAQLCEEYDGGPSAIAKEVLQVLTSYPWPGNVRELFHTIESAFSAGMGFSTLYTRHLPQHLRVSFARDVVTPKATPAAPEVRVQPSVPTFKEMRQQAVEDAERTYLKALLAHTKGDLNEAQRVSGLSRSRLYDLLKRHGIRLDQGKLAPQ